MIPRCSLIAAALVVMVSGVAGASGVLPPHDPTSNVAASPAFNTTSNRLYTVGGPLPACWRWQGGKITPNAASASCVDAEVQATNHAHRLERIAGITLPRDFTSLDAQEQLFVLVDLERVARGEVPVIGLSRAADAMAQQGASANADPVLSHQRAIPGATGAWTANWAAGVSPLDANYSWMYLDGWGGKDNTFNFDCTSAHAKGCWGHRNDILVDAAEMPCYSGSCALVMGAGEVSKHWSGSYNSYSELIIQVSGSSPALFYSWKQALAEGAKS
jgi:hypothetical protein